MSELITPFKAASSTTSRDLFDLDQSPDAVVGISRDGTIFEWNRQAERDFQHLKGDVIGRNLYDLLFPSLPREKVSSLVDSLRKGFRSEVDVARKNGESFPVDITILPLRAPGAVTNLLFFRDVTEKRRGDLLLKIQYEIQQILNSATRLNPAIEEILRCIGQNLEWDFGAFWVPDSHQDELICAALWDSGELSSVQFAEISRNLRFRKGQGLVGSVWSSGQPAWTPQPSKRVAPERREAAIRAAFSRAFAIPIRGDGSFHGVLEFYSAWPRSFDDSFLRLASLIERQIVHFIERKSILEALAASEHKHRLIVDAMPVLISYVDRGHVYRFANQSYAVRVGEGVSVVGMHVRDVIGDEAYAVSKLNLERALSGERLTFEVSVTNVDGDLREIETTYIPDQRPDGHVAGIFVLANDITAKNQAQRSLAEAVHIREEFLSIASHELRTPLTPIKLQMQSLEMSLESGEEIPASRLQKAVHGTLSQIGRLQALVDDLLDMTRISSGRLILNRGKYSINEILRNVTEQYRVPAAKAGMKLFLHPSPDITVICDRLRIEQVLVNLVSNALKYAPAKPLSFTIRSSGSRVQIRVQDQGPGIAEKDLKRIFERYERIQHPDFVSGLGLGLYIAQKIVAAHGGKLWAESPGRKGTTFVLELPLEEP